MISKIAFIGATGSLGKPVAKQLVNGKFELTALVRDVAKASASLPKEIKLLKGDVSNSADLDNLLRGQDAVYINLNLKPGEKKNDFHAEIDGLKNILSSAKKMNIKRVAFISSLVKNYQGMNGFDW